MENDQTQRENIQYNSTLPNENRDGQNESLWQAGLSKVDNQAIASFDQIYDVLIVGGGITGMTSALLLQKAGKKCVLAEAHHMGFGTTGGTSAHINTFADTTFAEVEKAFSAESARLFARAINEAVTQIHANVESYNIDCDFEWKDGYVYAEDDKQAKELDGLYQSTLRAGVKASETISVPTPVTYKKAVLLPGQAQFHPLKYLSALQKEFVEAGGVMLEGTLIDNVESESGIHIASSGHATIKAEYIIYATHIPPGGINVLHFENAPYRSYVIAARLSDESYPDALVYDMQEPYHYFRTHVVDGKKYLVAGGHDHKTGHGDAEQAFNDLINYVKRYYKVESVDYKWSAQYFVPADGLPYIGKLPGGSEKIYAATGYNGNGMILGTASARVISDLILKNESVYEDLFDPARIKPIAGFTELVKENADVAYRFIADRFSLDQLDSLQEIPENSGKVIEYKNEKLAVYKDSNGQIHALNPVCTHAMCVVAWNNSEISWDCPCHGARFDPEGNVLTGPARKNLEKVNLHADMSKA